MFVISGISLRHSFLCSSGSLQRLHTSFRSPLRVCFIVNYILYWSTLYRGLYHELHTRFTLCPQGTSTAKVTESAPEYWGNSLKCTSVWRNVVWRAATAQSRSAFPSSWYIVLQTFDLIILGPLLRTVFTYVIRIVNFLQIMRLQYFTSLRNDFRPIFRSVSCLILKNSTFHVCNDALRLKTVGQTCQHFFTNASYEIKWGKQCLASLRKTRRRRCFFARTNLQRILHPK